MENPQTKKRPNILWIITDQHSPHVTGFEGNKLINTPNIDLLAQRGTFFEAAYCQAPLCVPSRISMLTGKWAHKCSAYDNNSVLFPEHVTLPALLTKNGYATAAVGKMHFRGKEQMHGFQYRPYGDLVDGSFHCHQPEPFDTAWDHRWHSHEAGRLPFAGPTIIPESLNVDPVVTIESISWLAEFVDANPDKPFFLNVSYPRPHFPLTAPKRFLRKYVESNLKLPPLPEGYPDSLHPHDRFVVDDFGLLRFSKEVQLYALAAYYACVEYVDDCIGKLLKGLEDLGCLDNTYIIYTSDHGEMGAEHGLWWKRTYYDASARVPLIIVGPGIEAGKRITDPVELADLFPTICDWAGAEKPTDIDGETLIPLLTGQPDKRRKKTARSDLTGGFIGAAGGHPESRFRMIRDKRWKVVEFPDSPPRLFDMVNDPQENTDLADAPPEDAPFKELLNKLAEGGTWEELGEKYVVDNNRIGKLEPPDKGAAQYQLADGRIVQADAQLYA